MGCGGSLPEQENTKQESEKPTFLVATPTKENLKRQRTPSKSPIKDPSKTSRSSTPSSSTCSSSSSSRSSSPTPSNIEKTKVETEKLESERERVRAELDRIRSGTGTEPTPVTELTSATETTPATMGVVNSSMNGTRTGSPRNTSKEIAIDRHTLEAYLQLEKDIAIEEQTSPLHPLDMKTEQLHKLVEEVQDKTRTLEKLKAETISLGKNVTDEEMTKNIVLGNKTPDVPLDISQELYLASSNKKEIAEQELTAVQKQKDQCQEEVRELEKQAHKLQELYKKQDNLLDKMFGGSYGSMLENRLEQELDTLESHRGRILEANFKWRQAQMMLEYACKQLAVAVQKWQDLPTLPTIDLEIRYSVAAETRNNLVAAGQNLNGAQRYLDNVEFPYCEPGEVNTLNKATEYVFTDMQSADRHSHAQTCYSTSHKRANALLQWFDTVINTTIMKDLTDINDKVKGKTLELREERVRLIKQKLIELWGSDVDFGDTLRDPDVSIHTIARAMLHSGHVAKVDGSEMEGDRANTPPLLSNSELAPMPSNNIIFGNMYEHYHDQLDHIATQHQQELQTFIKDQEQKNQKIRGSLEEKLALRRQRRALQNLETAQKNALSAAE